MTGNMKMTVNVSLCGSIPRSQMSFCSKKRLRELSVNSSDLHNSSCNKPQVSTSPSEVKKLRLSLPRQVSCETINVPVAPLILEPPSWAVAAKGDAKLEPIGESCHIQSPVDLTTRAVFNIGRSQNSDVQLLHCTSSRRHAILFHHPNGNCYVVDCGSAHGTYVNGERVRSAVPNENNHSSSAGTILPYRVKKGALVRFGGPGAPTYILKSFSVGIRALMHSLGETKQNTVDGSNPNNLVACLVDNKMCNKTFSTDELVILNTRLNSVGVSSDFVPTYKQVSELKVSNFSFLKKRSIISFDEESDSESELNSCKKLKLATVVDKTSDDEYYDQTNFYESQDIAIVSPSRQKSNILFNFFEESDRPVVSPTPLLDENQTTSKSLGLVLSNDIKSVLGAPLTLPSSKKKSCRVSFCDRPHQVFYPSLTPDSSLASDS